MVFRRIKNKDFMILPCTGVRIKKTENPASALGPKLEIRRARQIDIWIGAAQNMWKKPQQKSIRETSVEM
jgi:hypothetical protein